MKTETTIHIPERGCHNCRLHCINHKECASDYPCKQGMEWRPILPIPESPEAEKIENSYLIIQQNANSTRVYKNGEKISPTEIPICFARMTDTERLFIEKIQEEYFSRLTPKPKGEDDLIQYVTNLLYAASDKYDYSQLDNTDFDAWVEEKTGELSEYYKSVK